MENSLFTPLSSKIGHKLICNKNEKPPKSKTIVLDLENTLVYSSSTLIPHYDYTISVRGHQEHSTPSTITYYVQKRPALDFLMAELVRNKYEIIIFTSATKEYADAILDKLQVHNHKARHIDIRLYRDSCLSNKDGYVKDITGLGKDLKNIIIVDDNAASYKLQPENAFPVKHFSGDLNDRELCRVKDFSMIAAASSDVRETIRIYLAMSGSNNLEYEFLRGRQRELQTIVPEKKIIVLELMDTLVKRSKEVMQCGHDFTVPVRINGELCMTYIQKRPGLDNLLAELEQNYEIVLYTRYTREQADPVLDKLDIGFYLNRRLYRDNCQGSGLCKDIGVLNKDLNLDANVKNVVFVDCDASALQHHPYNGFLLNPFQDDNPLDTELCKLKGFCKGVYLYDDVREAIANFNRNGARRRMSYFR
ncbi:hypothetical protein SUGI_0420620 [Cryptomeria japonica]|nr:hypothetical protein SUGI_0420620 [Cryptomeria japonica]